MAAAVGQTPERSHPFTIMLGRTTRVDAVELGGKGGSLARLVAAGFPVPATGVVTTTAYRQVVDTPQLRDLVRRVLSGETIDDEIVDDAFADAVVGDDLRAAIDDLATTVGAGDQLAIRSSATVEDLGGSSFAGQYTSFLEIPADDPSAVLGAVRGVWASLWHRAPVAYRRAFGIDESDVAMAVVVMRMIPAETAGVVFTVDPGGRSDAARVEAVAGLGEGLVSGRSTPDAWVVARCPELRPPLPVAVGRALDFALDVERVSGVPVDVEWAAIGDEVSIVQSRPITVLGDDDGFDSPIDDHELTTAGIVEMVPGVLGPLLWEINRFLMEQAFRSVLGDLGLLDHARSADRPFVRRVRGRMAIDFEQLRTVAASIPGAVQRLEADYFGVASDDDDHGPRRPEVPATRLATLRRDLTAIRARHQVMAQGAVVVRATVLLRQRRPDLTTQTEGELLAYVRRLIDLASRTLASELGVATTAAVSFRRLENLLSAHLGADEGPHAAQRVTAHLGTTLAWDRAASAAVFGGPTWAESSTQPLDERPSPTGGAADRLAELEQQLRSVPGWNRRRLLTGQVIDVRLHVVRRMVADVIGQLRLREQTKAALFEIGGEVRRVHLELGRRLVERGGLQQPHEVELLSTTELVDALDGQSIGLDVIRRRQNWLGRYAAEGSLPVRFVGVPDRTPVAPPEGTILQGWAASPGRARGTARVVYSARGAISRGDVLVAESTDASWSPLFLMASAVVVERGGPLSHAAILARELGLPAVLNVPGATRAVDGKTIFVDGDHGTVVIESESGSS